jgi:hypothetical protein
MSAEQHQTNSSGADKKSFNIRVPQLIALRIEEQALSLATAPTTLIQSIIIRHFENEGRVSEIESATQTTVLKKLEAIRILCDSIGQTESKRYGQMLFEIVKNALGSFPLHRPATWRAAIESIMDACEEAARQYIAQLSTGRRKVGEHPHSAGGKVARWSYVAPDVGSDGDADTRDRRGAVGNLCGRARVVLGGSLWRLGRSRVLRSLDTRVGFHPGPSALVPIAAISRRTVSLREHVRVSESDLLLRALVSDWFAHYSLCALMPTGLILLAVGKFLFARRLDAADDQYVRGTDVIAPRKLARELRGDGIEIGGVRIPRSIESQHFQFVGSPGSGKSSTWFIARSKRFVPLSLSRDSRGNKDSPRAREQPIVFVRVNGISHRLKPLV